MARRRINGKWVELQQRDNAASRLEVRKEARKMERNHALEARQNAQRALPQEPQTPGKRLAPTYRGIVPLLIAALTDGTDKGKAAAKAELYQMADLADRYNASGKD